jgi:hypothetical protein
MRKLLLQSLVQMPLTEAAPPADQAALAEIGASLARQARRRLGRSLSIREVDAGSCNGCELEIHALNNAFYDLERFGLRFVASPRHADVLLVTGPATRNMREALERTWRATPDPKWVVALARLSQLDPDLWIFAPPWCRKSSEYRGASGCEPTETGCGADQPPCETASGFGRLASCFCATSFAAKTARSTAIGASWRTAGSPAGARCSDTCFT